MILFLFRQFFFNITANVSGLCDGGAIEAQNLNFAQKLN